MLLRQELPHRRADDVHLLEGLPGQPHDVCVACQQSRREAEREVHRHIGRRGMEHDALSEALIQVVDLRLFLRQRRLPAPEPEGRDVRILPDLPQFAGQVVQEGDHRVVKGAQGLQSLHSLHGFRSPDDILQSVKTERHKYRCTP